MKIESRRNNPLGKHEAKGRSSIEKGSSLSSLGRIAADETEGVYSFEGIFLEKKAAVSSSEVDRLIREIDELGGRLKRSPHMGDFQHYRDKIKEIFRKILPNAYEVEKTFSAPTLRKPVSKEYHLVKKVDKSLDSLLEMIQTNHIPHLQVASKIVEIRGLIINILK